MGIKQIKILHNMRNFVIKNESPEMGREIIKYFKRNSKDKCYDKTGDSFDNGIMKNFYYGIIDGKFNNYSTQEVIAANAEIITLPEKKTFPRKMLVWDNEEKDSEEKIVLWENTFGNCVDRFIYVHPSWEEEYLKGEEYRTSECKNAKELPEPEEMTLEQVCKELGRNIKIVK